MEVKREGSFRPILLQTQNDRQTLFLFIQNASRPRLAKTPRFDRQALKLTFSREFSFVKFYIFIIKFLPRYKRLLPGSILFLSPSIGVPGLDVINVLDFLGLGEKLGMGHNVMSHNSLFFFAAVIEIFPKMHRVKR